MDTLAEGGTMLMCTCIQGSIHTGGGGGGGLPPFEFPPFINQHKYYYKVVLKHKQQLHASAHKHLEIFQRCILAAYRHCAS